MKIRFFSLVFMLVICSCATNFDKVDFKYTNLAHMSYKDAIVELNIDPEDLIFAMSNGFRAKSYEIIERKKLDFILVETPISE